MPETPSSAVAETAWAGRDASIVVDHASALVATVVAAGEFDLVVAPALDRVLRDQVRRGRRFLRLDLTEVTFLDATVLGVIVDLHRELAATDGRLSLIGVHRRVRRLLDAAGLEGNLAVRVSRPDPTPLIARARLP